ncbi:hypothetical protein, partial [Klebsiella pneumoniae]|uniref:hypothetical protein n=1 Tax=Klebsiella pneumoniae TaxID=573 RepID=UPI00273035D5
ISVEEYHIVPSNALFYQLNVDAFAILLGTCFASRIGLFDHFESDGLNTRETTSPSASLNSHKEGISIRDTSIWRSFTIPESLL